MAMLFGAKYSLVSEEVQELSLLVDPNAQRELKKSRVSSIAEYIKNAVRGESAGAFFAPLVISKRVDGLYIVDGQHRWNGIQYAIRSLLRDSNKLVRQLQSNRITNDQRSKLHGELTETKMILERVRSTRLPMMIYEGLTLTEEKQLFHDLNVLSAKAPVSLALMFDSSDLYVRIAKETLELVDGLSNLVVVGSSSLSDNKLFLFSTIHKSIVKLLGSRYFKSIDVHEAYPAGLEKACRFLEIVLASLPVNKFDPIYLYRDAKLLQGLGEFVRQMDTIEHVDGLMTLQEVLKMFQMKNTNNLFATAGGAIKDSTGRISFKGTGSGIGVVVKALTAIAIRYDSNGVEVTEAYKAKVQNIDETEVETPDFDIFAEDEIVETALAATSVSEQASDDNLLSSQDREQRDQPASKVSDAELDEFFRN